MVDSAVADLFFCWSNVVLTAGLPCPLFHDLKTSRTIASYI